MDIMDIADIRQRRTALADRLFLALKQQDVRLTPAQLDQAWEDIKTLVNRLWSDGNLLNMVPTPWPSPEHN